MRKVLDNGLTIIYEKRESDMASFCFAFKAGALYEEGYNEGIAHVVEHMVFKGTINRSEGEINNQCDEIFAFQNAMTNYSYSMYYGTTLWEDFYRGLDLFTDILINPSFKETGFKEEMEIILQELIEWRENPYQHCEDLMLYNSFKGSRFGENIIGTCESLSRITIKEIKEFYLNYYTPDNCVLAVTAPFNPEDFIAIMEERLCSFTRKLSRDISYIKKVPESGVFVETLEGLKGAKLLWAYPVDGLSQKELNVLKLFNRWMGVGTSSIIYDEIRTKRGIAYEVGSELKQDNGMNLWTAYLGTSKEKAEEAIMAVEELFSSISEGRILPNEEVLLKLKKGYKLFWAFKRERGVEWCKLLALEELLRGDYKRLYDDFKDIEVINCTDIKEVSEKLYRIPILQLLLGEEG